MLKISKQQYDEELRKAKVNNVYKERRKKIKDEKRKFSPFKNIETNKIIAIYLFVLLNIIIFYSMAAMWILKDLSYLGVFITDIGAQVLVYMIYCLKAYHGKKQEEYIKFEKEKLACECSQKDGTEADEGTVG